VWLTALDYVVAWWRRPGEVVIAATLKAILCVAALLTILTPPVYRTFDQLTGIPNSSRLVADCTLVFLAWAVQPILTHFSYLDGKRGRVANAPAVAVVILVMMWDFAQLPATRSTSGNFTVAFAGEPWVLEYTLTVMLLPALTAGRFVVIAYPFSKRFTDRTLRWRQHLQTLGWAAGLGYTIHQCLIAGLGRFGIPYPAAASTVVANSLFGASAVLLLSGGFFSLCTWFGHYRAYRRLYPLWALFYDTEHKGRLSDALRISEMCSRLEERRMQIYDAVVLLQPYIDSSMLAYSATPAQSPTATEAATTETVARALDAALRAEKHGHQATAPLPRSVLTHDGDELDYLLQISTSLASRRRGGVL
jgi:hypothetical protein